MRFWAFFKGNNNGQLLVGYRYAIDYNITMLNFSTYQSCSADSTECAWERIEVVLSPVLTQTTEVTNKNCFIWNS